MPIEELKIGVLALQGAFEKHREILKVPTRLIRYPEELGSIDGLIIPGGESTTMKKQMEEMNFALESFDRPIFGTCAGAILLADLGKLSIEIKRNGYGSQINSFITSLDFEGKPISALFIRAPIIESVDPHVEVLAEHDGSPVVVRQNNCLAATFHPELTGDTAIHDYFLEMCRAV